MDQTHTLILVAMGMATLLYAMTLYHLARGREAKAMQVGAQVVMESLTRQGVIAPSQPANVPGKAVNLGEEPDEEEGDSDAKPIDLSGVILARSEKVAEQMKDREVRKVMDAMNEAI